MTSEFFQTLPLENMVSIHDAERIPVKKSDRKQGSYPYYGASGITDYVHDYLFDGDYVLLAEDGDNLRSRNTPIAFMANGKFWVNNHAHILKGKDDNNTDFICYALQVADVTSYISGSTRPKITQKDMRKIPVFCPPKPQQKAIAHILGTLDDKIELNRQMNASLEAMAQALFKSWFVDFDPVIDNALAAGHSIPEPLHARAEARKALGDKRNPLPDAIQKQFPSRFVFNEEMGWVPEGWGSGCFGDIATHVKDNIKAEEVRDYEFYVGLEHIGRKQIFLAENGTGASIESNKSKFEVNDLLFGKLRPYFHKVCIAPQDGICSTDILVFRSKHAETHSFIILTAFTEAFVEYANMRSTGTRMPRASVKDMLNYSILIPPEKILTAFDSIVSPLWNKGMESVKGNHELSKLRDTLLPKLLSGQLRIPDAEKLAEEALA
ncbi:restriction endonuclease [bacterium endosymbiont of Escarpia laminata]|nr:MAG: restriction endonuclease [bacterium endosymbiont of Escarpia laminata]